MNFMHALFRRRQQSGRLHMLEAFIVCYPPPSSNTVLFFVVWGQPLCDVTNKRAERKHNTRRAQKQETGKTHTTSPWWGRQLLLDVSALPYIESCSICQWWFGVAKERAERKIKGRKAQQHQMAVSLRASLRICMRIA